MFITDLHWIRINFGKKIRIKKLRIKIPMHHLKDNNINFLSTKIILVKVNCN